MNPCVIPMKNIHFLPTDTTGSFAPVIAIAFIGVLQIRKNKWIFIGRIACIMFSACLIAGLSGAFRFSGGSSIAVSEYSD